MSESQTKVTVNGKRLFAMLVSSQQSNQTGATQACEPAKQRFAAVLREAA